MPIGTHGLGIVYNFITTKEQTEMVTHHLRVHTKWYIKKYAMEIISKRSSIVFCKIVQNTLYNKTIIKILLFMVQICGNSDMIKCTNEMYATSICIFIVCNEEINQLSQTCAKK